MTVLLLLIDAQSSLSGFFSEFGYLAPFTILVLCGFGLPIPEEVTMLGSGFLLYQGRVEAVPIIVVCFIATLIGDSIPYFLGRKFGRKALRIRSIRRALNPARIRTMERRFKKGGRKTVLACRFIPGLRLPAWFTAGTLGMPYFRFLVMDGLGAAIMVPFFVLLGRASGEKIHELEASVQDLTQILGFVVVSAAAVVAIHFVVSRWLPGSWRASQDETDSGRAEGVPAAGLTPGPTPGPAPGPTPSPGPGPAPAERSESEFEPGDRP